MIDINSHDPDQPDGPVAAGRSLALNHASRQWKERTANDPHAEDERFIALLDSLLADGGDGAPVTDLPPDVVADLITGLRRRHLRDIAVEYVRPSELNRARELWALLARHCDPADQKSAAPLLTLAAYTALVAKERAAAAALIRQARTADPDYLLAELLARLVATGGAIDQLVVDCEAARVRRLARRS
ncbi:DUF4192 family protein [Kitasatospora purpeofusca]|uniref:DUF4192 family protein n=1 Tax=Kitasatospora purpeofusca TaxID=67352 RepID=UPI0035D92260